MCAIVDGVAGCKKSAAAVCDPAQFIPSCLSSAVLLGCCPPDEWFAQQASAGGSSGAICVPGFTVAFDCSQLKHLSFPLQCVKSLVPPDYLSSCQLP